MNMCIKLKVYTPVFSFILNKRSIVDGRTDGRLVDRHTGGHNQYISHIRL